MFKAGHTYRKFGDSSKILCVASNKDSAAFKQYRSFSIKSHKKVDLYEDLGVRASFRSFVYKLLG